MNSSNQVRNASRNLRALFILALILTLPVGVVGAYGLAVGNSHPGVDITMPTWKFGQLLMLLGIANLFVYAAIFFQMRQLIKGVGQQAL